MMDGRTFIQHDARSEGFPTRFQLYETKQYNCYGKTPKEICLKIDSLNRRLYLAIPDLEAPSSHFNELHIADVSRFEKLYNL